MHRCIELARKGQGSVSNGAMVGSVLVRDRKIIAEAFHEGFGKSHAERALLENFKGEVEPDDILYVNLEPCCHQGKTPPCTGIIIERGVKHVIVGMTDPDLRVSGKGIWALRKAGIEVLGPIERAACERLNRGFISVRTKGRPWITLKRAQTRDGHIAQPDGSPMKITNVDQDRWSHEFLRARHDAILVGVETVVRDDPELMVRHGRRGMARHAPTWQPYHIILDPHLRIPLSARVTNGDLARGTIIVANSDVTTHSSAAEILARRGVRILEVPLINGRFDFSQLWKALTTPSENFYGITSILVEGGARTWESFREAGVVDEEAILIGRM